MGNSYANNQIEHKVGQRQPNIKSTRDICIKCPVSRRKRPAKDLALPVKRYVYLFAQDISICRTNELKVCDS